MTSTKNTPPQTARQDLTDLIRKKMKRQDLGPVEIAEQLGISYQAYNQFLKGTNGITIDRFLHLAKILKIRIS